MKPHLPTLGLAVLAGMSLGTPALAATVTLEATWVRSQNGIFWSSSYFTGIESGTEWRSNFVFDLTAVSATVSAAHREIDGYDYASSAPTETITLYDSSIGYLVPADLPTFGDLGNSGNAVGSVQTDAFESHSPPIDDPGRSHKLYAGGIASHPFAERD